MSRFLGAALDSGRREILTIVGTGIGPAACTLLPSSSQHPPCKNIDLSVTRDVLPVASSSKSFERRPPPPPQVLGELPEGAEPKEYPDAEYELVRPF